MQLFVEFTDYVTGNTVCIAPRLVRAIVPQGDCATLLIIGHGIPCVVQGDSDHVRAALTRPQGHPAPKGS